MLYPPHNFAPSLLEPRNGDPTMADHARFIDKYQSYLASVRKHLSPAIVGGPWVAGNTLELEIAIPPYTADVGFEFITTGAGTITITNTHDTYNSIVNVYSDQAHTFPINATPWATGMPSTATGNGGNRALSVANGALMGEETFTLMFADLGAPGLTLKVYTIRPFYEPLTVAL